MTDDNLEVKNLIERGIKKAGSKRQLAMTLGLSGQTSNVNMWLNGDRRIPPHRLQMLIAFLQRNEESQETSRVTDHLRQTGKRG